MSILKIEKKNNLRNSSKANLNIEYRVYKNILTANNLETELTFSCDIGLDFSCQDTSQYAVVVI